MKNKTNSEESRDGKKHKISAMRDTHISPRHLRFGRCHVTKPLFGNWKRMKLCNIKFPSAVHIENNSLRWFSSCWWILSLVIHEKRFFILVGKHSMREDLLINISFPNYRLWFCNLFNPFSCGVKVKTRTISSIATYELAQLMLL